MLAASVRMRDSMVGCGVHAQKLICYARMRPVIAQLRVRNVRACAQLKENLISASSIHHLPAQKYIYIYNTHNLK